MNPGTLLKRSRYRWLALGWLVLGYTLLIGVPFLIYGSRVILDKSVFMLFASVPGGIHGQGVVKTALSLWLMYGLFRAAIEKPMSYRQWRRHLKLPLLLIACDFWFDAVLVIFAPEVGGTFSWLAVLTCCVLACLPMILAPAPPPPPAMAEHARFLEAVTGAGIDHARALRAAETFFRGVDDDTGS